MIVTVTVMAEIRSPKAEIQIKNRLAAHRKKFGSPNFKDILRQKCRARMKAKRGDLFDQLRSLDNKYEVRGALATILEDDIKRLHVCDETDLMDTSMCDDEPNEEEKWILNEYERLMENSMALVELEQQVVCPMCEKGVLENTSYQTIICSLCSLVLPSSITLGQLEHLILEAVDAHSSTCQNKPQFTIIPDNNTTYLLLVCCLCNYFYTII